MILLTQCASHFTYCGHNDDLAETLVKQHWNIDNSSWHCSHVSGYSAFLDPNPTASEAIRVLGPWVPDKAKSVDVEDAMAELVKLIEGMDLGRYVVFGGYSAAPLKAEYEFPIYSGKCGFVPSLATRGKVIGDFQSDREWVSNHKHRSGLRLQDCSMNLDRAVVHPITLEGDLHRFCEMRRFDRKRISAISENALQSIGQTQVHDSSLVQPA